MKGKVILDAFVETYHFSTVHKLTAGDLITSREFPNGKVDAIRLYPKHRSMSALFNIEHKPTFAEKLAGKVLNSNLAPVDFHASAGKTKAHPQQINPLNLSNWVTDILVLFPMCNLQPFHSFFSTQNYWPLSHDRTLWELMLYMRPIKNAAEEVACDYCFFQIV